MKAEYIQYTVCAVNVYTLQTRDEWIFCMNAAAFSLGSVSGATHLSHIGPFFSVRLTKVKGLFWWTKTKLNSSISTEDSKWFKKNKNVLDLQFKDRKLWTNFFQWLVRNLSLLLCFKPNIKKHPCPTLIGNYHCRSTSFIRFMAMVFNAMFTSFIIQKDNKSLEAHIKSDCWM